MATVEIARPASHGPASQVAAGAASQPLVGRMGPWQLVKLLGEGNLTRVYLSRPADAPATQRAAYVVKFLRKEWWRDPQAIEVQRREAWVGSQVSHPEPGASPLGERKRTAVLHRDAETRRGEPGAGAHGARPPRCPRSAWIARQTADALAALFAATGMIHSDVKPANILVSPSGHATLLDFGFAASPERRLALVDTSHRRDAVVHCAEMVTSALAADPRADIYSLGVTLYEMLAGRRPFESDDPGELAMQQRDLKPADVRRHRPDLPEDVAALVMSMLAKDPLRRPDSARELARRLVRLEIDCFALR